MSLCEIKKNTKGPTLHSSHGLFCCKEGGIGRPGGLEKRESNLNNQNPHKVKKLKYRIKKKEIIFHSLETQRFLQKFKEYVFSSKLHYSEQ